MASPKDENLFFFDPAADVPLTGLSPTFTTYKDDLGNDLAQPVISEVGGGWYKFTPVFADPDRSISYIVDGGVSASPRYIYRNMRPEDWNADNADTSVSAVETKIDDIHAVSLGKWEIKTTGVDANRMILYAEDGVTVLKKFDLFDDSGAPTSVNPFVREPV